MNQPLIEPRGQEFLSESIIEKLLRKARRLSPFWEIPFPLAIFRSRPTRQDPLWEIQLAWDLGDRLETYCWLWVDARNGEIIRQFPA